MILFGIIKNELCVSALCFQNCIFIFYNYIMENKIIYQNLSPSEMKNVGVEVRYTRFGKDGRSPWEAPCSVYIRCSNGKELECSTEKIGEKCYIMSAGIGDQTVPIGIACGNRPQNCNNSGGSGSGGSGPTEPGGGEDPDKPGVSGSGGSGSEPSVPGEGENPNKPGGSGSGGSGTEPSVPDNHNGKGNCCKNKRLL